MSRALIPPANADLGPVHALGWNSVKKDFSDIIKNNEKRYINLNNLANSLSYFLSPIVGLIRIIANALFLSKKDANNEEWGKNEANFLKAQVARGVIELLCLGPLLLIVDTIFSIGRAYER